MASMTINISDEMKQEIGRKAAEVGMSASAYVVSRLENTTPAPNPIPTESDGDKDVPTPAVSVPSQRQTKISYRHVGDFQALQPMSATLISDNYQIVSVFPDGGNGYYIVAAQ